jgi:hypothetical protein
MDGPYAKATRIDETDKTQHRTGQTNQGLKRLAKMCFNVHDAIQGRMELLAAG